MELTTDQKLALAQIRTTLTERLQRLELAPFLLEMLSVFQLVNLLFVMVGQTNYLGTFTGTCRTLEDMFGWDPLSEKPGGEPPKQEEPKPVVVN